ncbi:ParA family partition ATPase [Caldovatus aquaticus]|uniref:AAA family ATPase n=1 Tax=Caldovatus aquaticus TaxID=2865671 RepID=A0ABS7EZ60_9PROT|nr:ParA family partition ATPase [Caldovatus aquaticus]MBW8268629.1 AAA family ATPase [Caldovatus aquaticus]
MAFVVAVAQRKGGAGKSTVAATLATALAAAGARVALLDTDPQGTLARWHAERCRAQGGRGAPHPLVFDAPAGWRVGGALDRLRRGAGAEVVLLDTPPHDDTDARLAIRNADLVLVPLQPSPADLWATEATLGLAAAERRPVRLVLNRVPAAGRLAPQIAAEIARRGLPLLETTLGNRSAYASAFAWGLGVVEAAPRSVAAEEARRLAAAVAALGGG